MSLDEQKLYIRDMIGGLQIEHPSRSNTFDLSIVAGVVILQDILEAVWPHEVCPPEHGSELVRFKTSKLVCEAQRQLAGSA